MSHVLASAKMIRFEQGNVNPARTPMPPRRTAAAIEAVALLIIGQVAEHEGQDQQAATAYRRALATAVAIGDGENNAEVGALEQMRDRSFGSPRVRPVYGRGCG